MTIGNGSRNIYDGDGRRMSKTGAGAARACGTRPGASETSSSTGTAMNPFTFGGQYTDRDTGLVCFRARFYDPATGQFLTRDPIEAITRSAYGYAGNNPLNATDPTGLFCVGDLCTDGITDALDDAWDSTYEWGVDHVDEASAAANGISMVAYASCALGVVAGCGVGGFFNGVSFVAQTVHAGLNCARSRDANCTSSAVSFAISVGGLYAPPVLANRLGPAFSAKQAQGISNDIYDLFVWMPSLGWNTPNTYKC